MHEIVIGLGFGDESKGATVDWLCATRDIEAVIRFNGGPQAAHNVVLPDGHHHTFSQFGSGTFRGVKTHLSEHMLVNPFNMVREAQHLEELGGDDVFGLVTVSEDAFLVTPYHAAANRARERARGSARHGSTGQGVGETRYFALTNPDYAPRVGDIRDPHMLRRKLEYVREFFEEEIGAAIYATQTPHQLAMLYSRMLEDTKLRIVPSAYVNKLLDAGDCVFEGAQGVLLDEDLGFHPHTTWTCTTQQNARTLLDGREAHVWGLTRAYHTRHGMGPFPTEDGNNVQLYFPEPHNGTYEWAGSWRVGELDLTLLNYAVRANGGVDDIILSHCDYVGTTLYEMTYGYDNFSSDTGALPLPRSMEEQERLTDLLTMARPLGYDLADSVEAIMDGIQTATGVRPTALSYGPTWADRVFVEEAVSLAS